jgi:hypothetical protein
MIRSFGLIHDAEVHAVAKAFGSEGQADGPAPTISTWAVMNDPCSVGDNGTGFIICLGHLLASLGRHDF